MNPGNQVNPRFRAVFAAATALAILALASSGCFMGAKPFDARKATVVALTNMTAITNRVPPELTRPPTEPYRLGPGDQIEVEILGVTGTRNTAFLGPDGLVYYDLAPAIDMWGMTLQEARKSLETGLAPFYKKPNVTISLREVHSKRVWVLGRLNATGIYPLTHPMTLVEAIAHAGGLFTSRMTGITEELADLEHSFIVRNGEMLPVNFKQLLRQGDMSQNVYLMPDDFVYLPSALSKEVYVLGAVKSPRPLGFIDAMTVVGAIARAYGPTPAAYLSHVVIVRGSLSQPSVAFVDYRAIITGLAPDVRLEPRDIVYVPDKPYLYLEKYAKLAVDSFVKTEAANEGGRAGSSKFQNVQPTAPIQLTP
jgi:polysaccharide biosynthesis/export protein